MDLRDFNPLLWPAKRRMSRSLREVDDFEHVEISRPFEIEPGVVYERVRWLVSSDFDYGTRKANLFSQKPGRITIRDCEILGQYGSVMPIADQANSPVLRINCADHSAGGNDVELDGFHAECLPGAAIECVESEGSIVGLSARLTGMGIHLPYGKGPPYTRTNRHFEVHGCAVEDTWRGVHKHGRPSRKYPGQWWTGGTQFGAQVVGSLNVSGFAGVGEGSGAKWMMMGPCDVANSTFSTLMFEGRLFQADDPRIGPYRLYGVTVNKALGYGLQVEAANTLQLSYGVEVVLRRSAVRTDGWDGHGIQLVDSGLDAKECAFSGANGQRGGHRAAALDPVTSENPIGFPAHYNADFGSDLVNDFSGQARRLSTET